MKVKNALRAVSCSLISFALVFYLIPKFFAQGTADFLWMALMVVFPALLAVVMLEQLRPLWLFLNLPVHYALLFLLAEPLSKIWGSPVNQGLGWFSYMGTTFVWPLVVTTVQFAVLRMRKKARA